jgi:catechol 2,3-dioxygenase-like lactoylglutathione lyase family enzyme
MIASICPKLPMRDLQKTAHYYTHYLGFSIIGKYPDYLIVSRDGIELHFFMHRTIEVEQNDGQVYFRVTEIDRLYEEWLLNGVSIHPNGPLETKPWGQREFSVLDPDFNLLTFGEPLMRN